MDGGIEGGAGWREEGRRDGGRVKSYTSSCPVKEIVNVKVSV